ncbi:MAG TPA: hypothetical protein PKY22_10800, partial [Accumulibacter sp.]|nr:hypothetical protein [Accumulibacter sp.]
MVRCLTMEHSVTRNKVRLQTQLLQRNTDIIIVRCSNASLHKGLDDWTAYGNVSNSEVKVMKAPKILPWIAHKSGISEELALKLWRRAAGEAEVLAGSCTSPDYYRLAMERFIDYAEAEGGHAVVREDASQPTCVSWLWRHQSRVSKLS